MAGGFDPSLILVSIDWTTHVVTLHRSDGAVGTAQLPVPDDYEPTRLRKTTWSPALDGFLAETIEGDEIALELPRFDETDQLNGRLVVYVDQCIWRRLSDAQDDPSAVGSAAELAAAQELISLVEQRRVILPLSSGHHTETTQWGNDNRRYRLGLTTLRLSRGWQMRDPLTLRRQEIRAGLLRHVGADDLIPSLPPFTLQPNAASRRVSPAEVPERFPPEAAYLTQTLSYLSALIATILDTERIAPTTQKLAWVEVNQGFSDWLDGKTSLPGAQKRRSVDVLFLRDIGDEIAEEAHRARLHAAQMSTWVRGPMFTDMQKLPSVGIYRSILQDRHLNVGTVWASSDLTDMIYLSAAGGYADIVVAERHMTAMMRQAQRRLLRVGSAYPSLTTALPVIRDCLNRHHKADIPPS